MKIKNLKDLIIVVIFVSIIGSMPILGIVVKGTEFSTYERRILSKAPKASSEAIIKGEYGRKMEDFISDHFMFRIFFLGVNGYSNLLVGRNGAGNVYLGKDGYLIEKPWEDFEERIKKNLSPIAEFAKKNSTKVQVMLVPSTGAVLKDKMPFVARTYYDYKVLDEMKDTLWENITFIDIRAEFEKNINEQIYYKTDHHWTGYGAYLGYKEYCYANNINTEPIGNFNIQKYMGFYGTTYSRSCLWFIKPDEINIWKNKSNENLELEIDNEVSDNKDLFFMDNLESFDPYTVFLDGNHGIVKITTKNESDENLLIVRDSFANCFVPFLTKHYSDIYLIDLRYYKRPVSELINENNINNVLVLYGMNNFAKDNNIILLK